MKQYLITIKEIIDVINLAKDRDLIKKNIKFWLKSGQPVKVIAEEVMICFNDDEYHINFLEIQEDMWKKYHGKKGKLIFIEEE